MICLVHINKKSLYTGRKGQANQRCYLLWMYLGKSNCKVSVEKKNQLTEKQFAILQSEMKKHQKSAALAHVLCIFLGIFGIHKFYLRNVRQGIVYLILGLVSIPSLIVGEFTGLISFGASAICFSDLALYALPFWSYCSLLTCSPYPLKFGKQTWQQKTKLLTSY